MSLVSQSILSMYPPLPDAVDCLVFDGSDQAYTVPAGTALITFGTDTPGDTFMACKASVAQADWATVNVLDGTASVPNPSGFVVTPGEIISMIAANGVNVYILRYGADTAKIWR